MPLLLSLGEEGEALDKAVSSGDTDMVYLVLFHMYRQPGRQLPDFLAIIRSRPVALALFTAYCRKTEPELMKACSSPPVTLTVSCVAVLGIDGVGCHRRLPRTRFSPYHRP